MTYYSAYERELAREFIAEIEYLDDPINQLAHLLADERREALEEAAKACVPFMRNEALSVQERDVAEWIHARIRALKGEP